MTVNTERLGSFTLVRDATDISGVLPEQKEVLVRGDLKEFLSRKFFVGAVESGLFKPGETERIPQVVSELLGSLFSKSNEQKLFTDMSLVGSVPKEMAWDHITGNIPGVFWPLHRYISELRDKFKRSDSEILQKFSPVFDETPIDLNVKVKKSSNTSIRQLLPRLADRFGVSQNEIMSTRLKYPGKKSKKIIQEEFHFTHGGYFINALVRPIPSNRHVDSLIISIRDEKSQKEKYRIYVNEPGMLDKRSGKTTLKQDTCIARLTSENGSMVYSMEKDAVDVLRGQDSFDTISNDTGTLVELFFRGLRQNLIHTLRDPDTHTEYIILAGGQPLDLPALDMFFPRFIGGRDEDNRSIFGLNDKLHELKLRGKLSLLEGNKQHMRLLQKELALCLTIDPYTTIQALRDSGIALAIPGLRNISSERWDKILTAFPMMTESMIKYPRNPSVSSMGKQRELYLGYGSDNTRHFDGVERFMQALFNMNTGTPEELWESYLLLWEEPKASIVIPKKIKPGDIRKPVWGWTIPSDEGPLYIHRIDGLPLTKKGLYSGFEKAAPQYNNEGSVIGLMEGIRSALNAIDGKSHISWVSDAFKDKSERRLLNVRHEEDKRLLSLGLAASILQTSVTALTPKQMERMYIKLAKGFNLLDFNEAFYELKLTGWVSRKNRLRPNKFGDIIEMSLYTFKDPSGQTDISDSSVRERLYPFYEKASRKMFISINLLRRHRFERLMDTCIKNHIHSTEVIASLDVSEDYKFWSDNRLKKSLMHDLPVLQRALVLQYEASDEV